MKLLAAKWSSSDIKREPYLLFADFIVFLDLIGFGAQILIAQIGILSCLLEFDVRVNKVHLKKIGFIITH